MEARVNEDSDDRSLPAAGSALQINSEYDCVVVGSGHAGSCAALSAIDSGCKKVLMVDKCPEVWKGGNGYFTAGAHRTVHAGLEDLMLLLATPLSASDIQRTDISAYTEDEFIEDIQRLASGRADENIVEAVVRNSRETLRWLRERVGIKFSLSFNRQAYEIDGRAKFWGGMALSVEEGGKGLMKAHQNALKEAGVEIWFEARTIELVLEDKANEAEIGGIIIRKCEENIRLKTRSVVLAAGGFEASPEKRAKHLGAEWLNARVRGTPYNTGDGFELASAVGAKMTGDWKGCHSTAWDANALADGGQREMTNQYTKSGYPLGIMVNINGLRFVDEGEDFRNYTYAKFGKAILQQPEGCAFQIWDSQVLSYLRKEEYGDDVVQKAWGQSIEELADKLSESDWGLKDKARFVETIREFNDALRTSDAPIEWNPAVKDGLSTQSKGIKLDIPKSNWALGIEKAPFMAVKVACGITFTFGGVAIDGETAQVISGKTNEVIRAQREVLRQPTQDSENTITLNTPTSQHSELNRKYHTEQGALNDVSDTEPRLRPEQTSKSLSRLSPAPDTPSTRTGPPRSLSFAYVIPGSHTPANHVGYFPVLTEQPPDSSVIETDYAFSDLDTEFRGALEHPSFREQDRKGKRRQRERSNSDDGWNINPMKWFQESPKEEKPSMDFPTATPLVSSKDSVEVDRPAASETDESGDPPLTFLRRPKRGLSVNNPASPSTPTAKTGGVLRRAFSVPYSRENADTANKDNEKTQDKEPTVGNVKWAKLRSLLPHIVHPQESILPGPSMVTSQAVNITDELITGGLSTLMLRLWIERDERGNRRIPILFHRLRIRVSDSLHPMHRHGSVFRIECEYANGAARWVIYRELRDFLSLHAHYTVSNVYNRNVDKMPEFPTTSLPYFKFLKKEGREKGSKVDRADFARLQREALENYLINLIRAVMFHPSSNRLAGFLEISALSLTLAQSGGAQYKAGFLRIEAIANGGGGFGRKSVGWKEKKKSRWCAVRESYLVVLAEPGELTIWDVFLLDSDFRIERPKRYYRQGLGNLLHADKLDTEHPAQQHHRDSSNGEKHRSATQSQPQNHISPHLEAERKSIISSIRTHVSKIFHTDNSSANGHPNGHPNRQEGESDDERNMSDSSSWVGSSLHSRPPTPMLDPSTNANPLQGVDDGHEHGDTDGEKTKKIKASVKKVSGDVSKHIFYIVNSQMRLKLSARNERQMLQFITALEKTAATSHNTGSNRFDSFAPIRLNVAAQWLVDGRDYFWNLSRAMLLAKESIYIHDWWLSPGERFVSPRSSMINLKFCELTRALSHLFSITSSAVELIFLLIPTVYTCRLLELQMRRPNKDRYRLDHLLERKAKEGVKIYIILYQEVSNRTTPTDSNYAKQRLIGLHPNVMVQRSPSHFQTGTFYWAHHEKMCVIDQTIAFMGGLDLCFGRWDTPQHVLADDTADTDREEIWPGKDYSNPRLSDFYNLNKPEEDMYDRTKVPRMPWHDVAMQIVGQPARDLARHFVQRPGELTQMGLTGTCELQICRSAGPWSLGTPGKIEHSIQNAYLKAIQMSEHFVYIENQFFITSTVVNDVKVENNIGDAIVHRILRAHRDGTRWKCCILIPALPGFTFPVDHSDASAIRIILECQNRTIARGPNSIFSRLRKEGINPDDYISVFSLRNWAKMRGDVLTTEQVYIHAKVCIVDDRLAIIGSANINERSQRGDRDSELAAVIRDTDMIDSTMAGKPFKVGRFAHTLRVRLMREHLGIDVDALDEEDLMTNDPVKPEHDQEAWDPDKEQAYGEEGGVTHIKKSKQKTRTGALAADAMDSINQAVDAGAEATSAKATKVLRTIGLVDNRAGHNIGDETITEERKDYNRDGQKETGFASSVVPTLEEKVVSEQNAQTNQKEGADATDAIGESFQSQNENAPNGHRVSSDSSSDLHAGDNTLYGAPANAKSPVSDDEPPARSLKSDFDDEELAAPGARAIIRENLGGKSSRRRPWTVPTTKPRVEPQDFEDPISDAFWKDMWVASAVHNTEIYRKVFHAVPDDLITTWKQYKEFVAHHDRLKKPTRGSTTGEPVARIPSESGDENTHESQPSDTVDEASQASKDETEDPPTTPSYAATPVNEESSRSRRPARGSEPFEKWEREEMEKLLGQINGQLVVYSTRFLEGEDIANNFLFNADRLLPLPIYN
ncbi:hypothetical protein CVT25_013832 [Psilocybe cyanescens]|uniref:Phospholipase D1 n=1 Tax=Psilocybe cyanescens TaxID=93625 RepID=A0A409XFX1_PSICY|nr:hypothetical protein CVT25_013832 [Psilocybe cyanescens]